jgi:hypothetical protein
MIEKSTENKNDEIKTIKKAHIHLMKLKKITDFTLKNVDFVP